MLKLLLLRQSLLPSHRTQVVPVLQIPVQALRHPIQVEVKPTITSKRLFERASSSYYLSVAPHFVFHEEAVSPFRMQVLPAALLPGPSACQVFWSDLVLRRTSVISSPF